MKKESKQLSRGNNLRIIGLDIKQMNNAISKNIQPGWYPFGNFPKPNNLDISLPPLSSDILELYQMSPNLPNISINCIIGKNGSGKSTLLDIFYRIINNLSCKLIEKKETPIDNELQFAYGVNADLYFECDGKLNIITCDNEDIVFYRKTTSNKMKPIPITSSNIDTILSMFFYTIGVNYSIYAFNKYEYQTVEPNEFINGEWLEGIFHKNDGYLTPLTLVPFRKNGIIDIRNENKLAQQRIIVLSILGMSKHEQFPIGYYPKTLSYKINYNYKNEKMEKIISSNPYFNSESLNHIIEKLELGWNNFIGEDLKEVFETDSKEYKLTLFYLAYKTLKICFTYNDYYNIGGVNKLKEICEHKTSFLTKNLNTFIASTITEVISKIIDNPDNHITLKIFQCINFIKRGNQQSKGELEITDFIKQYKPKTYDEVLLHLYPPFFEQDILFRKVRRYKSKSSESSWGGTEQKYELKLSKMSSGEKQMLYMISYILYHLKNLQSVNKDNYRVPYHHINIIFDEAELYYHPDYQRKFISMLIECFQWTNIDRRKIRSINILIATHSPFVLTDILTESTLYLIEGKRQIVESQTFGGNYYDMLRTSFFFDKTAIGNISAKAIRKWIKEKNDTGEKPKQEIINMIGDPFIIRYLENIEENV